MMETILLGTYTRNTSKGIYQITLNKKTERLENLKLIAETSNPTYLEYDQDTHKLYAVYQQGNRAGISIWDYEDGSTQLLETITQEGTPPCFVHYDPKRDESIDANYHMGQVNIYKNGEILQTLQYPEGAKAHFAHTHPRTGDLYTIDLGNDTVQKYRNHALIATYHAPKGSGPRHLVYHPTQDLIYVYTEHSNQLIVLEDGKTFKEIQIIDALDQDDEKSGAAIRITKDAKFIYVSNRGHDSLTVFSINDDFTVNKIQNISVYGKHPRDFNLSLDEDYVVVGNKDTNNLTLFKRDAQTGLLTYLNSDTRADEVVSVLFIEDVS